MRACPGRESRGPPGSVGATSGSFDMEVFFLSFFLSLSVFLSFSLSLFLSLFLSYRALKLRFSSEKAAFFLGGRGGAQEGGVIKKMKNEN